MSSRFRAKSFSGKGCFASTVCRTELGGDAQQALKTQKDLMFPLVLIFLKLDPSSLRRRIMNCSIAHIYNTNVSMST